MGRGSYLPAYPYEAPSTMPATSDGVERVRMYPAVPPTATASLVSDQQRPATASNNQESRKRDYLRKPASVKEGCSAMTKDGLGLDGVVTL